MRSSSSSAPWTSMVAPPRRTDRRTENTTAGRTATDARSMQPARTDARSNRQIGRRSRRTRVEEDIAATEEQLAVARADEARLAAELDALEARAAARAGAAPGREGGRLRSAGGGAAAAAGGRGRAGRGHDDRHGSPARARTVDRQRAELAALGAARGVGRGQRRGAGRGGAADQRCGPCRHRRGADRPRQRGRRAVPPHPSAARAARRGADARAARAAPTQTSASGTRRWRPRPRRRRPPPPRSGCRPTPARTTSGGWSPRDTGGLGIQASIAVHNRELQVARKHRLRRGGARSPALRRDGPRTTGPRRRRRSRHGRRGRPVATCRYGRCWRRSTAGSSTSSTGAAGCSTASPWHLAAGAGPRA